MQSAAVSSKKRCMLREEATLNGALGAVVSLFDGFDSHLYLRLLHDMEDQT